MISVIFTDIVDIYRRPDYSVASHDASSNTVFTTISRDIFNNPVYGSAISGYEMVYEDIKVRIQWSGKTTGFKDTGDLIYPTGEMYIPNNIQILPQDKIYTVACPGYPSGIQYSVKGVVAGFIINGVVDFYLADIALPV